MTVVELERRSGGPGRPGGEAAASAERARRAQPGWAAAPLDERLAVLARARRLLAARGEGLAATLAHLPGRTMAESLSAEVLPLAEAIRFLERRAERILRPRRLGTAGRPAWLAGCRSQVEREPHGVVLVLAPSNYPLFLPGVQVVQALAAGNAVLLKPGRGGGPAAEELARLLHAAGLAPDLLAVLPEAAAAGRAAIAAGVDRVVLTGGAETGRRVLADLAPTLTPATVELSGVDAAIVRRDADLDLVVAALGFGWRLNRGATCIAPRRLFVDRAVADELERRLAAEVPTWRADELSAEIERRLARRVPAALAAGARPVTGGREGGGWRLPIVLADVPPDVDPLDDELFTALATLTRVDGDEEALARAADSPWALGATVFGGDEAAARRLARRVRAGVVVVNDMIVPTADPRLPFGGRADSGFGVTRGAEGLLAMTAPKAIAVRRGRHRRHLEPTRPGDGELFLGYLALVHGGPWGERRRGLVRLGRALLRRAAAAPAPGLPGSRRDGSPRSGNPRSDSPRSENPRSENPRSENPRTTPFHRPGGPDR